MSRYGIKNGGDIKAGNIHGGVISVDTDVNGEGAGVVFFKQNMPSTNYGVGLSFEDDTGELLTGTICVSLKGRQGFRVFVHGASLVSKTIKIGWTAIEAISAY